jgi:uncharacterized protein (DUF1501 family)
MTTRRDFLAGGVGALALARLMGAEPVRRPRATRVIQLFMSGAASTLDLYDYKPELERRDGRPWDPGGPVELFQSTPGTVMKSPWTWTRRGEAGHWMSSLVPKLAERADELAFVRSMTSKSSVHGPATFLQNTGFLLPGFPSMGAWISYGLGRLGDNLPTFVVLPDPRGFAPNGPGNWSAGFLPAAHQGTLVRTGTPSPIHDLFASASWATSEADREGLELLDGLNRAHRPGDAALEARIRSYETAAKLQLAAPEAMDCSKEPESIRRLYGLDRPATADFGLACLTARRLVERGVRVVQVWSGADNGFPRRNWDSHEELARDHGAMGESMDGPAAALLADLKQRGLLDETIVHWSTEFGRMPCSQGSRGRDHNPFGFSNWLAGGGVRAGASYGATDEWGWKAADRPTTGYDVHATMLHLMGIDHTKLTFRHNGIDRRLTDVHGHVLEELLA